MQYLELLAPARNLEIGIAAIDCGADAVYIAGPDFGARKAAGNSFEDIAELCRYAHRFGARIFVTYNILLREDELEEAHRQMLLAQEAGADAFIIRDPVICSWKDITVPLHASTQCAIRTPERAVSYQAAGCSRLVLERELSMDEIRKIASAVDCELEFFVHGALCVCYSGDCRLSEYIDGRSADRGECIQACRSMYDLVDGSGRTILRNKAILSLKDYNLRDRIEDLAEAGICSFKIEGRLKNASYVKNVTRDYDLALNALVAKYPDRYCRASFGRVEGGFAPDTSKTFNRGYTSLFLDGKRDAWSSKDTPKSVGEAIGTVEGIRRPDKFSMEIRIRPLSRNIELHNGDGFAFTSHEGITGFRGDVCSGMTIRGRDVPGLKEGMTLYRNINSAFEKLLETRMCKRVIPVNLDIRIHGRYVIEIYASSEDGRHVTSTFHTDVETALDTERARAMLESQLSKHSGIFAFSLGSIEVSTDRGSMPLLSASTINSMRRLTAGDLEAAPCNMRPMAQGSGSISGQALPSPVKKDTSELMRTRYCVRYELGMCPRHQGAKAPERLFIINNGRRFALNFDCRNCEMTVTPD